MKSKFCVAIFTYFFLEHDDEDDEFTLVVFFHLRFPTFFVPEKYAKHWPTRHTSDPHFPSSFEEEHWHSLLKSAESASVSFSYLPRLTHTLGLIV